MPSVERWIAAVEGALPPPIEGLKVLAASVAEGRLVGGNLALLAAMCGTPLLPPMAGAILFLEDVGEAPYRIDRMLTQLILAGASSGIAGILLGAFTRCKPGPDGTTVEHVLEECLARFGVPVLAGVAAGHIDDPIELPLGAIARIDATRGAVTFLHEAVAPRRGDRRLRSSREDVAAEESGSLRSVRRAVQGPADAVGAERRCPEAIELLRSPI